MSQSNTPAPEDIIYDPETAPEWAKRLKAWSDRTESVFLDPASDFNIAV